MTNEQIEQAKESACRALRESIDRGISKGFEPNCIEIKYSTFTESKYYSRNVELLEQSDGSWSEESVEEQEG